VKDPVPGDQTDLATMLQFSQYFRGFDRGHHPFAVVALNLFIAKPDIGAGMDLHDATHALQISEKAAMKETLWAIAIRADSIGFVSDICRE